MTEPSPAVKAMHTEAVRFVALDRLLGDYADAQASLIGHTSGRWQPGNVINLHRVEG